AAPPCARGGAAAARGGRPAHLRHAAGADRRRGRARALDLRVPSVGGPGRRGRGGRRGGPARPAERHALPAAPAAAPERAVSRRLSLALVIAPCAVNLLPVWLLVKQAITPEAE